MTEQRYVCKTCRTVFTRFRFQHQESKYYCSESCYYSRQSSTWEKGLALVFFGIFFSVLTGNILIPLIVLISLFFLVTINPIGEHIKYSIDTFLFKRKASSDLLRRPLNKSKIGTKMSNFQVEEDARICCIQTGRLGERYCPCGRAVPEDLFFR